MGSVQKNSQSEYRSVLDRLIKPNSRWLDVGCGTTILPLWMRDSLEFQTELVNRCEIVCGCDPVDDRPHHAGIEKYVGDCATLPYPNGCFDVVTANMVVEHVLERLPFAREIERLLSPGGL